MEAWAVVADRAGGFSVRIPSRTPNARSVSVEQTGRDGFARLHVQTPDRSELYVEVVAYPGLIDHREAASDQRAYLSDQSPDGRVSRVRPTRIGSLAGSAFRFAGTLGGDDRVRRFVFLDSGDRTYRVVYDPTSRLNRAVLRSLLIGDAGAIRRTAPA